MRPKLRSYVYWTATDAGVLFRGISGTIQLRGNALTPWVRRLTRMLDGSRTWATRMRGRPPAEIALWERLLQPLLAAGFVVDLDQEEADGLTPAERERYQSVIDYLGEWSTSPAARFERFRQRPVYLRAEGLQGAIALRALVETGVADLTYQADPEATALINAFLAPYQDWPVRLRPTLGPMALDASGALLWTGTADAGALESAAAEAERAGIPFLASRLTAPAPSLAALGGCRLAHAWLAQATGLPPLDPVTTLEEVMTDVQAARIEEEPSVRPGQVHTDVQRPAAAQG